MKCVQKRGATDRPTDRPIDRQTDSSWRLFTHTHTFNGAVCFVDFVLSMSQSILGSHPPNNGMTSCTLPLVFSFALFHPPPHLSLHFSSLVPATTQTLADRHTTQFQFGARVPLIEVIFALEKIVPTHRRPITSSLSCHISNSQMQKMFVAHKRTTKRRRPT